MRAAARVLVFTGVFLIGAGGPAWAQSSENWLSDWYNRWHKAKFGHISAAERAAQSSTDAAYRSEPQPDPADLTTPAERRYQRWHKAKFGHDTPKVAAQKRAARDSMAFREAPSDDTRSEARKRYERWHKAKFGHSPQPRDSDR